MQFSALKQTGGLVSAALQAAQLPGGEQFFRFVEAQAFAPDRPRNIGSARQGESAAALLDSEQQLVGESAQVLLAFTCPHA